MLLSNKKVAVGNGDVRARPTTTIDPAPCPSLASCSRVVARRPPVCLLPSPSIHSPRNCINFSMWLRVEMFQAFPPLIGDNQNSTRGNLY